MIRWRARCRDARLELQSAPPTARGVGRAMRSHKGSPARVPHAESELTQPLGPDFSFLTSQFDGFHLVFYFSRIEFSFDSQLQLNSELTDSSL